MAPPRSSSPLFLAAVFAAALLFFAAAAPLRAGASAFPEALDAGDGYFSDEAFAHLSESLTKCEERIVEERKRERESVVFSCLFSFFFFFPPPLTPHLRSRFFLSLFCLLFQKLKKIKNSLLRRQGPRFSGLRLPEDP